MFQLQEFLTRRYVEAIAPRLEAITVRLEGKFEFSKDES